MSLERAVCCAMFVAASGSLSCSGTADGGEEQHARQEGALYGGREASVCERESVVEVGGRCSGVLLHPLLVAYAAHCGDDMPSVRSAGGAEVAVRHCAAYPDAGLGALDVAYCLLDAPIVTTLTPVATGCELESVVEGAGVTLAGYGEAGPDGKFGVRRVAESRISALSETLISVEGGDVGTCLGDSGGPLYLDVGGARRVIGVATATPEGACESHTSLFAPLAPVLEWMETDSGLDLTPCGAPDGSWAPTPSCTEGEDPELACGESAMPPLAETCGAAFDTTQFDIAPPELDFVGIETTRVPSAPSEPVRIELAVSDAGWGIESVQLTWAGPEGMTWTGVRSIPPYRFEVPAYGIGHHSFYARARDHAGNRQTEEWVTVVDVETEPSSDGCAFRRAQPRAPLHAMFLLAGVTALARRSRRARSSPRPRAATRRLEIITNARKDR